MMHTNLIERLQYAMDLAAADGVNAPSGKHWELAGTRVAVRRPDLTDYEVNIKADQILALLRETGTSTRSRYEYYRAVWETPYFRAALALLLAEGSVSYDAETETFGDPVDTRPSRPAVKPPQGSRDGIGTPIRILGGGMLWACVASGCDAPAVLSYSGVGWRLGHLAGCVDHAVQVALLADHVAEVTNSQHFCTAAGTEDVKGVPDFSTSSALNDVADRIVAQLQRCGSRYRVASTFELRQAIPVGDQPYFDSALALLKVEGVVAHAGEEFGDAYCLSGGVRPAHSAVRRSLRRTRQSGSRVVLVGSQREMECGFSCCDEYAVLCYQAGYLTTEVPCCVAHAADAAVLADHAAGYAAPLIAEVLVVPPGKPWDHLPERTPERGEEDWYWW